MWPGQGRRQDYYAEMDVVLTGIKQRLLSGPTVRLVPPGTQWGWDGGGMGVPEGLHVQKSRLPSSCRNGKTQPHFPGFGGLALSKSHHSPCLLLLPLQFPAGLLTTGSSAVLRGAMCNK